MKAQKTFIAAFVAALAVTGAGTAGATPDARENRLAGDDRYGTARAVAEGSFDSATVAILASGETFPDALSAAYLSGAANSPILLTPQGALPAGITDTLDALGVTGVQIIGGPAAVSGNVGAELEAAGYGHDRLAGDDRYATSRAIAEVLPPEAIGSFGAGRAAIIATGENFADALAAGPLSAVQKMPILLTPGASLHPEARAALSNLDIEQVLIAGGTGAVSSGVEASIEALGIEVRRVAGANRQETARALAEVALGELAFDESRVMLARGDDFADALSGGARGGRFKTLILLTANPGALGSAAEGFIRANRARISVIDVLGGTSAISQPVVDRALAVARS